MGRTKKSKGVARRMIGAAISAGLQGDDAGGSTLRDVRLWVDVARNQALGEFIELDARPSGLRCDVVVTGELVVPRRVRQPRAVHLRPLAVELAPLRKVTLHLEVPEAGRKSALRALNRGDAVVAKVTLKATDARGHAASVERTIMLSLPG
jgi:hypothetical protein